MIKNVTLTVGMRNSCKGLCLMDNLCDSFNIGQSVHGDHVVCHLSDSDHSRHPEDLRPREGFTFIGTKVYGKKIRSALSWWFRKRRVMRVLISNNCFLSKSCPRFILVLCYKGVTNSGLSCLLYSVCFF